MQKDDPSDLTYLHFLLAIFLGLRRIQDRWVHMELRVFSKYHLFLDSLDPETHWKMSRQTLDHGDSFFQEFQTTSVASCDEDYAPYGEYRWNDSQYREAPVQVAGAVLGHVLVFDGLMLSVPYSLFHHQTYDRE
jgi:hypothetical protein